MLIVLAAAEFLGMTAWFSATAATPALIAEFQLDAGGASWLTIAVQAGFVAGTLASALANLPDVINARRLFALGCVVAAAANAMVTLAGDPGTALAMRLLTGAALACVYPPGMKIAAGWFLERRGLAHGIRDGAHTPGKAFPHQQHLQATIAEPPPLLGQLPQPNPQALVFRASRPVAVRPAINLDQPAGASL